MAITDADETRRLLYTIKAAARVSSQAEVVGGIVNHLAHHGLNEDPATVQQHCLNVLFGNDPNGDSAAWIDARIADLTASLNP